MKKSRKEVQKLMFGYKEKERKYKKRERKSKGN